MERNVSRSGPIIASEAVMMALVEEDGRQTAHEIVHEAATTVLVGNMSFRKTPIAHTRVADHLSVVSVIKIELLMYPIEYVDLSITFADRVLEAA